MRHTHPERWIEMAEARAVCARALLDQAAAERRRVRRPIAAALTRLPQLLAGLLYLRRCVGCAIEAVEITRPG